MNLKAKVGDVGDILELPQDALRDIPKITVYGARALNIENHKGIRVYSDRELIVNTSDGELIIRGTNISISSFDEQTIFVEGLFSNIILQPGG